ncbi:MAG: dienelactone hydrolase family protein [Dehalococcoidia bacterium]|jgi:carboxymethylenebutenolidase|nr:MAG: carboxymethylenebutenolidase [Chloroflexota bacterium]|tara:strand:- start:140 stop:805 length:666 start_codon:yes stop_codon:yes gene_type:complete
MGKIVEFKSNGKNASGYLASPDTIKGGIIVLQEWWGLNDHIKDLCNRFAAEGYLSLAPDMYDGTIAKEPDEAGKLMMALDIEQSGQKLNSAIDYLIEKTGKKIGTIGFCMGGALSLFAACNAGDKIGACVDFYGIHPSIKYDWNNLTAPVLGLFAEHDDNVNPNIPIYEKALKNHSKEFLFHTYPGTSHAFFNDTNIANYNKDAATDAWERVLDLYQANIQ